MLIQRCIGRYGGQHPGPLVIGLGGVHGNEPAGVQALRTVIRMLYEEPNKNPDFVFHGTFAAFVGNVSGFLTGERFLVQDLNRMWSPDGLEVARTKPPSSRNVEERELIALHRDILQLIRECRPERLVLLDLHTTSADGGIFTIPDGSPESQEVALGLHAPVINGLLGGIGQTLLHYLRDGHFNRVVDEFPEKCIGLAFESGQHQAPMSVSRSIAATINCLRSVGCVAPHDVDSKHDEMLRIFSENLPKNLRLAYVHKISEADEFMMMPGYSNFQPIKKGELLANSKNGPIFALRDGLILMPLYQKRGSDGFFVVEEIS